MAPPSPPITCHVLDTSTGRPAKDIQVTLTLMTAASSSQSQYNGVTNSDGRVTEWTNGTDSLDQVFARHDGDMPWTLKFETASYWQQKGIKPFFPTVHIAFVTTGFKSLQDHQLRPHWHVPLLLGPYNYTTYRGS